MGRIYSIQTNGVAVTTAIDLFEILANSAKPFIVHELVVSQSTDYGDAAAEGLQILFKRATGSYTSGSGGSSPTPVPHMPSDTSAGVTAEANNTTQAATGTGALTTFRAEAFNIQQGFQYLPTPEDRVYFAGSTAFVASLSAPADSITINTTLVIEELG